MSETTKVIEERLALWKTKLVSAGAAPIVLVGINPEDQKMVLCVPEGTPNQKLIDSLAWAVGVLRQSTRT